MTYEIEVLLKGQDQVIVRSVTYDRLDPANWTDEDVHEVLQQILLEFNRAGNPDAEDHTVSFLGLSWIVTPVKDGVAIAIEVSSGAVVAGTFNVDVDWLTQAITRVLAHSSTTESSVH